VRYSRFAYLDNSVIKLITYCLTFLLALFHPVFAATTIKIAIDAEFGIPGSTSAQAIYHGAQVAANEINAAGGVLGRNLEIIQRDNRGVSARAGNHLRELAADPEVIAVMCGKYSPLVVELLPEIHRLKMLYLNPWAAADPITEHGFKPNYVFRLSLRDTWAMQAMLNDAAARKLHKVALLLPNTEWGRSNLRAAQRLLVKRPEQKLVAYEWFNFGDNSLALQYRNLRASGAQTIFLISNEQEGVIFVNELAALPKSERLPIIAHWGITAGRFFDLARDALQQVDLVVVQTYSFIGKTDARSRNVLKGLQRVSGNDDPRKVASPVGVAHSYELVHLLARAIKQAGNTHREAVRQAMENLGPYDGLMRKYTRPFTPARHDALSQRDVFMARFAADGAIEPLIKR